MKPFPYKNKTAKEISGFDNEIIYIVKGDSFEHKEILHELGARFRKDFGWYFGSFAEKPESLPYGLEMIEVLWNEVGNKDGSFKNEDIIKEVIESKIFNEDPSIHIGEIGDRIEETVTVEAKREFESAYGNQICYTFRDENKNCYVWFTSSSTKTSFNENEIVTIRGTIKSHDKYRNINQNILSRVTRKK